MKKALELSQTVLLSILVLISIVLSIVLWNDTPVAQTAEPASYAFMPMLGADKPASQVVNPEEIVIHLGENRHVRFGPFTDGFTQTLDYLKKLTVADWQPVDFTDDLWRKISTGKAITIKEAIPPAQDHRLQEFASLILPPAAQSDVTLHVYRDGDEVKVLLLSGSRSFGGKAALPDFAGFVDRWQKQPVFTQYGSRFSPYYLPEQPLAILYQQRFMRGPFQEKQFVDSCFVDPTLVRKIKEQRTGDVIYTDGGREVQIQTVTKSVIYHNAPLQDQTNRPMDQFDVDKDLKNALDFIKDHGGLTGDFVVLSKQRAPEDSQAIGNDGTFYFFRQYLEGFHVEDPVSTVAVNVRTDGVQAMQRSLVYLGFPVGNKTKITLLPADQLWKAIAQQGLKEQDVQQIELVWHPAAPPAKNSQQIALYPVWEVYSKGKILFFDGTNGELWTDSLGWLDGLE